MRIVILSLTLILGLSGCAEDIGDFCDVALDLRTTPDLSAVIFDTDEPFARSLGVHNTMYGEC